MKGNGRKRPIVAILKSHKDRDLYTYRVSHHDWKETGNFTTTARPNGRGVFQFLNIQCKEYSPHHFFPPHAHPIFELYFVGKGRMSMLTGHDGKEKLDMRAGDCILVAPRQVHAIESDGPAGAVNSHFSAPKWPAPMRRKLLNACGAVKKLAPSTRTMLKKLCHPVKMSERKAQELFAKTLSSLIGNR